MAVSVKLASTLVKLSRSQQPEFAVDHRDGMTVWDLLMDEGFRERDAEAIAAIINDAQGDHDSELHDGDRVELIVNIQGGSAAGV